MLNMNLIHQLICSHWGPQTTKLHRLSEQKPYKLCEYRYKIMDLVLGHGNLHRYIKLPQKITVISSTLGPKITQVLPGQ